MYKTKIKEKKTGLGQLEPVKSFKINYANEKAHTGFTLESKQNTLVLERLENLNSQLSLFLKTYKITKNINNYVVINQNKQTLIKKLNHLIIKNNFLVNASLLNNTNKSIEFLTKGNFNKLKKYEKQVLLNQDKQNLLINFLANNKVFGEQDYPQKKLSFRTENYAFKIDKNFLVGGVNLPTRVKQVSCTLVQEGKPNTKKRTNLDFSPSGNDSLRKINQQTTSAKAQVRTYNFLQISLIKYLAISKKRKRLLQEKAFLVFLNNQTVQLAPPNQDKTLDTAKEQYLVRNKLSSPLSLQKFNNATRILPKTSLILNPPKKMNSLASGYPEYGLKIKPSPKDYTLNFLLKDKINNKSFLTYWLIPLAGLAFLSPSTFLYTDRQLPLYLISFHNNHPQLTNQFKEINLRCFNNLNLYINTKNAFNKTVLNTAPSNVLSSAMLSKNLFAYLWEGMQKDSLTENLRSDNQLNMLSPRLPNGIITDSHPLFGNLKNTLLKNIQVAYLANTINNLMHSQTIAIKNLNLISDSPLSQTGLLFQTKPFKGYLVASVKSKSSTLLKTVTFSTTRADKANLINPLLSKVILEKNLNYLTTSAFRVDLPTRVKRKVQEGKPSVTNKKTLKLLKFKIIDYTRLNNKNKILRVPSISEQATATLPFSLMASQKPLINYKKTLKKISMLSFFINQDVINLSKSNQSWTKSAVNIKEFFNAKSTINEHKVYINQKIDTPSQILFNSFTQDFNNQSYQKINGLVSRHQPLNTYTFEKNLAFKNTKNKVFTNYFSILGIGENFNNLLWNYYEPISMHTGLNLKSKVDIAAQDKETVSVTRNKTLIWAKDKTNPHRISLLPKKINLITTNTKIRLNLQNVFTQANHQDTGILFLQRQEAVKGLKHAILSKPFKVYGTKNLITKAIYKEKLLEIKGSLNRFGLINQKILTKNESLTNNYFHYITQKLKKFIFSNNVSNTKTSIISKRKNLVYSLVKPEVKGSISMIFKLKKMFKNNIVTDFNSVTKSLNNVRTSRTEVYKKQVLLLTKGTNAKEVLLGQEEGLNQRRLSLQKKRKAKKQRLETRQRKKRTRFFPRPTWLRYRMFVDFLKQRNLTSLINSNSSTERFPIKGKLVPNAKSKLNTSIFFSGEYYAKNTKFNLFKPTQKINYPRHLGLANIKTQGNLKPANYKDFEKKTNQPPIDKDKDKDKDTIFRDLWVWGYNNTTLNNYQQKLMFLLPNNTNILNSQKTGLVKFAVPKIKTLKTFNFSNKIQSIKHNLTKDTFQKILQTPELINKFVFLPNISNKSKILQNKNLFILTRLQWALNKTQTNTFTEGNKRYTLWGQRKLRNQSKNNKTKYLEKQFITNWERFFLNKKINHLYKKIGNKIQHKIKKLNYLTTYSKYNNNMPQKKTNKPFSKESSKTNQYLQTAVPYTENITLFNNAWWTNTAKNVSSLSSKIKSKHTTTINTFFNNDLAQRKNIDNKLLDNKNTVNISSTVIFHFCALISLVSISQVRCFIKFYIIFLYKLKNVYLFLITKISGVVENKVEMLNSSNKALNKTLKANPTNNFKGDINNSTGGNNKDFMLLKKTNKEQKKDPPRDTGASNKLELKLFTLIGLNLLKKHFSFRSETDNIFSSNKPSQISLRQNSFSSKKKIMFELGSKTQVLVSSLHKYAKPFRFTLKARSSNRGFRSYNFDYTKTSISVNNQTFTKANLISLKENFNIFNTKITQKKLIEFSSLPNSYKTKKIQFVLKKNTLTFFQSKKKFVFKSVFMFVDLFQLSIRSIKNFFFKPAEFTTNWVAFAFLVEWSSDLITIIPENIDIYLWTAFAKVSRNTNNLLIWNNFGIQTNNKFSLFFVLNNSSKSENIVANLVQTTQSKNLALLQLPSLIVLNYIIQRRILYLFDKFIETISQPDADLMRRQIKGTRFWDIWADFLVFFADYYNVNVFALSTIKAEQNNLIEKITNSTWLDKKAWFGFKNVTSSNRLAGGGSKSLSQGVKQNIPSFQQKQIQTPNDFFNKYNLLAQGDQELHITNINRWSINQYITYQSWHSHNGSNNSNGDLFIDYHPPKSFSHLPNIKYNKILLRPIGTLVCQINSGLLKRQVSKNILLVSPKNTAASHGSKETVNKPGSNRDQILTDYNILLIQALAGETELKIITDNAQRYALVNRGFAVGIKLLRDVFDAISLNTPCIFLLLDIHTIGERRPMLISDYGAKNTDDNGLFKEDFFGSQRDEVHEKNQVVYQLTRHAIAHYRKPFKGDYSLAIPTNLYSFQELARSLPTQTTTNLSLISFNNVTIKPKINYNNPNKTILTKKNKDKPAALVLGTHLKLKKLNKKIAPPSTSPFTVLLLKEEKKLKPNKIVEEFPWTGLPGEELATKARTSYSVRAKVSMLAELSLSNLSAKLDMITDLLVIIDSVRSNKGFVVFATTNVPQVLDPALRRPGRLDETICIPNISSSAILNFTTNYEIIKSVKNNFSGSALFSYSLPGVQFNKNLAFLVKNACSEALGPSVSRSNLLPTSVRSSNKTKLSYAGKKHNTQNSLSTMLFANKRKILTVNLFDLNTVLNSSANFNHNLNNYSLISDQNKRKRKSINHSKKQSIILRTLQNESHLSTPTSFSLETKLSIKALAYYQVGNILLHYYLNNYARISTHTSLGKAKTLVSGKDNKINYLTWDTKNIVIKQLMSLFGGKISQLLAIEKNLSFNAQHLNQDRCFSDSKTKLYESYKDNLFNFDMSDISAKTKNFQIATKIMLSFIHKRYLYRKNLIVPKLLSFSDGTVIDEPPSPPFSSLLIPAKRFFNYTRVFSDVISGTKLGQRKSQISFTEKINYHMELQSIKLLKNQQKSTTSNKSNYETLLKMTIADKELQTPTNINWYYQNRILKRHGQYLTNQWWNGQLSEHNAETVFLSDIDWRSSFIQNKQIQVKPGYAGYHFENLKNSLVSLEKTKDNFLAQTKQNKHYNSSGLDILLDFPDTDQYYNPRRRRWLLNKGDWSFWFNFDKVYSEEIISSWILESLINTYTYVHNNLELLDFITTKFITLGYTKSDKFTINVTQTESNLSKEIILTNAIKRF